MRQLLAYLAKEISDIMYDHQCIEQPNAFKFVKTIIKKINRYLDNKNWN